MLDFTRSVQIQLLQPYARPHCGVIVPEKGLLFGLVVGRQVGRLGGTDRDQACELLSDTGPITRELTGM